MNTELTLLIILFALLLWLGWRNYTLNQRIHSLTESVRRANDEKLPQDLPQLEELSNAIAALQTRLREQVEAEKGEHARLSAVLEQIPDGILISNAENRIQFANPAVAYLLEKKADSLVGSTVAETLRHHQLIEVWQKCKQSGEMQSEVIEVPLQQRFLQLIAIPDQYAPDGILLLIQDNFQILGDFLTRCAEGKYDF